MNIDRAHEIVKAINNRCLFMMELVGANDLGSLEGVSLSEMIEAKAAVEAENTRAKEHQREHGGSISISLIPDDRLIAAAYALENYHASNDAIVIIPARQWPYDRRALAVVGLEPEKEGEETA